MTGDGKNLRPELHYRRMNTSQDDTYSEDPRLTAITEKVIAFMYATDPEEWSKDLWTLFQKMWTESKTRRRQTEEETTKQMSLDDLKASLTGKPLTSPP